MAAFAVDLGWIYLNGTRVQRAADSAALAGVVYLPGDIPNVNNFTRNGAEANGYDIGTLNGSPTGSGGPDNLDWQPLADNKLEVTLDSSIETFFLKVFGFDSLDITRRATAEYIKPVPLGSPDPCFGIGPGVGGGGDCSPSTPQNFWAAVSGPRTNKYNGDQFSTRWWSDSGWSPPENVNTDYRTSGYWLAVEVPSGVSDLDVDIYDAAFYERGSFFVETGDHEQDSDGGADTHFQMYSYDNTPLDPTNNPPISGCSFDITSNTGGFENTWVQLCSLTNPDPGIYFVQIRTDGDDGGTNQYAVRAETTGGGDARVYGVNDISIFTNQASTFATLFLAEVDPVHAGKTLELELYDAGEDDSPAWMEVQLPDGTPAQCSWISYDENGTQTDSSGGSGNCRIDTSDGNALFNGELIRAQVDIPDPYPWNCSVDCWFKMYIKNSNPHDRTTWSAKVIGNPVRLTPNE
jgi:hypothetical protein